MTRPASQIEVWVTEAENLCRRIAPHELDGRGCYVVARSQLPDDFKCAPNARAWHAPWLDLRLQSWLESVGRFIGRGFCCVIRDDLFDEWSGRHDFLGTALHELGHYVDSAEILYADNLPADSPAWQHVMISCLRQRAADADDALDEDDASAPRRLGHGAKFVRACCHLRSRVERLGTTLYYGCIAAAGPTYNQKFGMVYERALASELEGSIDVPLRDILKRPYPPAFAQLWQMDTGQSLTT